jgi:transcription attenuation protein (tryptophan RNA-binding attenuator protein)
MEKITHEFVVIKAAAGGAQMMGLTRGTETKSHHVEMLDEGEVLVAQFTDNTSIIKVKGNAEIYTPYGIVKSYSSPDTGKSRARG